LHQRLKKLLEPVHHYGINQKQLHIYPLSGHMRCGYCGSMLVGQVKKGHLYYNCSHRRDRHCPEKKYIRFEGIEEQVTNHLSRVQLPDKFKKVLDAYFQHFAKERLSQEERERKRILIRHMVSVLTILKQ
jgi:hypothetical protein